MQLTYNGIALKICRFTQFTQKPVYTEDGADLLYYHFTVGVDCVWSPYTTASAGGTGVAPAPGNPAPLPAPNQVGDVAATSIPSLRFLLSVPRKPLTVDIGGVVILQSPPTINGTVAAVDATVGPKLVSLDVQAFHGTRSALVHVVLETWVAESVPSINPLASRWTMREVVNQDHSSSFFVNGTSVFSSAMLNVGGEVQYTADAFRNLVLPPLGGGFERHDISVTQSSDGTTLTWSYRDDEVVFSLNADKGIVKVEGSVFRHTSWTSLLPEFSCGLTISLWATKKKRLRDLWSDMIFFYQAFLGPQGVNAGIVRNKTLWASSDIRVNFPKRHATGTFIYSVPDTVQALNADGENEVDVAGFLGVLENNNNPYWKYGVNQLGISPPDSGTRGTSLASLFTQALSNPTVAPANPSFLVIR